MKKYILFLPLILSFISCADKERNLSSSDVIGCRMLELQGNTFFITAPIGALVQKTGNLFKEKEEQRDLKAICDDVRYGKLVKKVKEEELEQKAENEISNQTNEIVKENQEINN